MKTSRQTKILDIIKKNKVSTQKELTRLLVKEGYEAKQPTVSRDITELGLIKIKDKDGRMYYAAAAPEGNLKKEDSGSFLRVFREGFVNAEAASNILVVKTKAGMAMAVAACIDAMDIEGIIGSIAGDDTIMCAVKTAELAKEVESYLLNINV